jgi:hypothetical protein
MKKIAGALVIALVLIGGLWHWFSRSMPVAVVTNSSSSPVLIRLETDVGESYAVGDLAAGESAQIQISRRDKLLWAVAEFPSGENHSSDRIYTTTEGKVSVVVTETDVDISYVL